MISREEIIQDDIVKVLVNEDGLEEEMYAIVGMNTGNVLGVHYISPTEKLYKSACVYQLEDGDMNPAPYESVCEHYPSGTTFSDIGMKNLGDNMYVIYDEVDVEDSDSDIYDEMTDSEMDDFIVPDDEIDGHVEEPPGYEIIDKEWKSWEPRSPGARSFKETVDMIEMHAKRHADELNF
jgi:hypothetical protein